MKTALGYTLVELMIVISIVAILLGLGVSAYGRARDRQVGQAAAEQIMTLLLSNQKKANIGDKDCTGKYVGQQVITSSPNVISSQSICEGNVGLLTETEIANLSTITSATIIFKPLSSGTTLPGAPFYLDFVTTSLSTYRIRLDQAGTIESLGLQP